MGLARNSTWQGDRVNTRGLARSVDRTRARTAVGRVAALWCLIIMLAVPSVAVASPADGTALLSEMIDLGGVPVPGDAGRVAIPQVWDQTRFGTPVQQGEPAGAGVSASAGVVHPTASGIFYWAGDYLCLDGKVTNNESEPIGPIAVGFEVKNSAGTIVIEDVVPAAVYNLSPGESASVRAVYHMPGQARSEVTATVGTAALMPGAFPTAVNMVLVSQTMSVDAYLGRVWTCTFRNDSPFAVEAPIVGGWEYDAEGKSMDTLLGAQDTVQIAPGATFTIEAYAALRGFTPASVAVYCQAIPVDAGLTVIPVGTPMPIYRFFNNTSSSHFYTDSIAEADMIIATWPNIYTFEGTAYHTNPATNTQPLYRFFCTRTGSHFYTASLEEADMVIATWPHIYAYEGPSYKVSAVLVPNSTAVYRFVNLKNSSHFYTASAEERDAVKTHLSATYLYEGPAFWLAQ